MHNAEISLLYAHTNTPEHDRIFYKSDTNVVNIWKGREEWGYRKQFVFESIRNDIWMNICSRECSIQSNSICFVCIWEWMNGWTKWMNEFTINMFPFETQRRKYFYHLKVEKHNNLLAWKMEFLLNRYLNWNWESTKKGYSFYNIFFHIRWRREEDHSNWFIL